jgi:Methylamine utilisation protein MauE
MTEAAADLAYALQLSLGVVFLAAAAPKLRHPGAFAVTVAAYRILPRRLVPAIALVLIAIEAFLAFAFLTGRLMAVAVPLAAMALAGFFGAVTLNLRRGREVPCGCFGDPQEQISSRSLVRLGVLMAALGALVATSSAAGTEAVTLVSVLDDGAEGLEYLIAVGGVAGFLVLAGMWALSLPELVSVLRRPGDREALEHLETTG